MESAVILPKKLLTALTNAIPDWYADCEMIIVEESSITLCDPNNQLVCIDYCEPEEPDECDYDDGEDDDDFTEAMEIYEEEMACYLEDKKETYGEVVDSIVSQGFEAEYVWTYYGEGIEIKIP